jgi:S1-C subfamily serine protease
VTGIAPDSAARHARIRSGDVITTYDGQPVRTTGELMLLLMESKPGQRVTLGLFRNDERLAIPVELKRALSN